MSLATRTKALVGNVVGYGFLLLALVAAGYGVYALGAFAFAGLGADAVVGAMFAFGFALFCLVMGVYVRKAVAGTVLPLDVDTDTWRLTMFRGGQG
ncbi:hypothetical protein SAMN04487950_2258 [Halogranum rubrum]|uniref:Uncharacterized protein n=1 Tax=Halogranum rubrum TaxID=553466 RepID=A0A1I4ELE9_9EURY|nr:hypothetical protein [Halogranum rubrum]SFL06572.1 hypothetical protein SAMN04487950_2258 [Halogranum rubrum]